MPSPAVEPTRLARPLLRGAPRNAPAVTTNPDGGIHSQRRALSLTVSMWIGVEKGPR